MVKKKKGRKNGSRVYSVAEISDLIDVAKREAFDEATIEHLLDEVRSKLGDRILHYVFKGKHSDALRG